MSWVLLEIQGKRSFLSPSQQPNLIFHPPPPPPRLSSNGFNLNNRVSPTILLIIIVLAIFFFISGLLHLLVRFLLRPSSNRNPDEMGDLTAFQGQLQQLFNLHDSGVDQSYIDTLPLFNYKAIIGVKAPFDCAVCLCEFDAEDKLRLLPKCSHAFHMGCIDTWLLSHSTCPLCRANLVLDNFPQNDHFAPFVMVLESGSESSTELVSDRDVGLVNSHLSPLCDDDDDDDDFGGKSGEIEEKKDENKKVVSVKLGKYRSVDGGGEGSSVINGDTRRCFSMGSFAYVMDECSSLKVPIKKQYSCKKVLGHRAAMSECGCDSRREFTGFEAFKIHENQNGVARISKKESFSVSKIWLRGKKNKANIETTMDSSRRAFSFRLPVHRNPMAPNEAKPKNAGVDDGEMESSSRSLDCHEENASSFGRRSLVWLMGRQNKVVDSSFSSNV